jgi:hypothetical protein
MELLRRYFPSDAIENMLGNVENTHHNV